MKLVIFLPIVLLLPRLCQAQPVPSVTNLEVGSGPEAFDSKNRQAHERAQNKGAYKLRVRYLKVEGRWAGQVQLPLKVGDLLTPESLSKAMNALEAAITRDSVQGYNLRTKGEVGVLYIDVDFDTTPLPTAADNQPGTDSVGVIFNPYYVHVSLVEFGDNVLPIPRSALATFYENVPKPLLVLNPTLGVSYDRAFGTALGGAFAADLLNLSDPARPGTSTNRRLDVRGQGMKSVDQPFYRVDTGLHYSAKQTGKILQEFSLRADYNASKNRLEKINTRAMPASVAPVSC
jgi:hypothetical protein